MIRFFYKFFILFVVFVFHATMLHAQENRITAGFQFKPIFQNNLIIKNSIIIQNNIHFSIQPTYGFCAGMSIRRGITKLLSFETGINYVKRNFQLSISNPGFKEESSFSIIGYEIPLLVLVFIRLGEKTFMDAGLGTSFDFYPTDIYTYNSNFKHASVRTSWLLPGLLANIGFEYRTIGYGYFYLGASYHLPFNDIYKTSIKYEAGNVSELIGTKLQGNYLTLDLRYFFCPNLIKEGKKKKNNYQQ